MQNLGYTIFGEQMYERVGQQRIPLNASVELTMRCNLRCKHCYIPLSQRAGTGKKELSLNEFKGYFDEFADAGTLWLLLTGGEPLLRPDFLEIYDAAKRNGFIISLFTNGTLLNDRVVSHLAEYRPFSIEISIYGATQETYERVTGIPGSFKRCMQGIEMILEHGLPLKVKSAIMTLNQHELAQMKQLSENLGLKFNYDPVISPGIDGDLTPLNYRFPVETITAIDAMDDDRAREWRVLYGSELDLGDRAGKLFICGAGRTGFHMDAYGRVSLCISAREPGYDLRIGSFSQAWGEFFPEVLAMAYTREIECEGCSLRSVCSNCPALAYIEVGDLQGLVPFLCELTHQREKIFHPSYASPIQNTVSHQVR